VIAPAAFVILGLIGTVVAVSKGRSPVSWFIMGLLLGPVALVAALVLGRRA